MKIVALILESGDQEIVNDLDSFINKIRWMKVETIVVGQTDEKGNPLWEKQFKAITVMPNLFGKNR